MSRRYFGTDGIRGRVGEGPISADFVLRLGNAYGHALVAAAAQRDRDRKAQRTGSNDRRRFHDVHSSIRTSRNMPASMWYSR